MNDDAGTAERAPVRSLTPDERRAAWSLALARILAAVDTGIVAVAIPTIQRELGVELSALQWAMILFPIAYASFAIPGGVLADRFGRRRMYCLGLGIFAGGAALGSLAQGATVLVAARAIQGVGAGFVQPASFALLASSVDPDRLQRAVAIRSGASAAGLAVGPLVGAILVATLGWRSVFWTALPIAAIAFVAVMRTVEESRAGGRRRLDLLGAALVAAAVTLVSKGLLDLGHQKSGQGLAATAAGVVLAVLFVVRMLTAEVPLVEPATVRRRPIPLALSVGFTVSFALTGALFLQQIVAQSMLGLSAGVAGLLSLPVTVLFIAGTGLSMRLTHDHGLAPPTAGGLLTASVGLAILAMVGTDHGELMLLVGDLFLGTGLGLALPGVWAAAVGGAGPDDHGAVSGVLGLSQHLGSAVGVAGFSALTAAVTAHAWSASSVAAGERSALVGDVVAGDLAAVSKAAGSSAADTARDAFLHGNTVACAAAAAVLVAVAGAVQLWAAGRSHRTAGHDFHGPWQGVRV